MLHPVSRPIMFEILGNFTPVRHEAEPRFTWAYDLFSDSPIADLEACGSYLGMLAVPGDSVLTGSLEDD